MLRFTQHDNDASSGEVFSTPPPNASSLSSFTSPSSLKIPSGADDPGFK
jgi:hypothetical protein